MKGPRLEGNRREKLAYCPWTDTWLGDVICSGWQHYSSCRLSSRATAAAFCLSQLWLSASRAGWDDVRHLSFTAAGSQSWRSQFSLSHERKGQPRVGLGYRHKRVINLTKYQNFCIIGEVSFLQVLEQTQVSVCCVLPALCALRLLRVSAIQLVLHKLNTMVALKEAIASKTCKFRWTCLQNCKGGHFLSFLMQKQDIFDCL